MRQSPKWYYNEFKQVGTDYASIEEVSAYDSRMRKLRDIEKEANCIREVLNIKKSDSVLEIGTGTGELAINISAYCKQVIAVDISKAMINFAKMKAESQNKLNIEFCNSGFLTFGNHDETFDVIITQLALHHLPDYWKMIALRRIYEMLKEGGRLYLRDVVFPSSIQNYEAYFAEIIADLKKSTEDKIAEETEIHIKEEFSTLDWIMEGLLKNVGFYLEDIKYEGIIASYVCKKRT